jgi:hydrogenase small subunit
MRKDQNLGEYLRMQGVSRRGFLKFCSATASLMALPRLHRIADAFACADR